nr:retrovirus-related Pol polyprotein LINE-1 [Tanacetum cinerariifolium]
MFIQLDTVYVDRRIRRIGNYTNTGSFPVKVGLHQGSAISPYLFALILDELSRGIQENVPWSMIFADDIVLMAESAEGLNNILESWRKVLKCNGLRVSKEKSEYLRCNFGRVLADHQSSSEQGGSGEIENVWTCGKTMLDMIPNGLFRAELDVDSIIDKMREGRLKWFGHVKWRPQTTVIRRVEALLVDGLRRRGRPKLRWEDRLKQDMKELLLSEDMTSDRNA